MNDLLYGLLFSVGLGAIVAWLFWLAVGGSRGCHSRKTRSTSNLLTGSVERGFFTVVVAYEVEIQ
jgi:hypothetical protein